MPPEKRQLTDEAQEAISEAVRIVAEDRLYARLYGNAQPKTEPALPEPVDPPQDPAPVDPDAPVSPPAKPEPDPVPEKKRASLYWGESDD